MSKREKPIRRTSVGGQALIEGIMMLGPKTGAMAVRTKDQSIYTEEWEIPEKKWYQKCPFVRGVFNFVAQLKTGSKYLNKSMEKSGYLDEDEKEPPSKFEKWLDEKCGKKFNCGHLGVRCGSRYGAGGGFVYFSSHMDVYGNTEPCGRHGYFPVPFAF